MSDPSKKIAGEGDQFNDVFHSHGDDIDENEDANIDYDQFFTDFYDENEDANIDYDQFFTDFFDKNDSDISKNTEIQITDPIKSDDKNIDIDLIDEEQRLSQKLSQLSASCEELRSGNDDNESHNSKTMKKRPPLTPTTPVATTKKLKTEVVEVSSGDVPKYLSKTNKAFEEMISLILETNVDTSTIEELRQIALLEHKTKLVDLNMSLWTIYLRSGTGKLKEDEQRSLPQTTISTRRNLSIWPQELKSTMLADRNNNFKADEINHDSCLNYVYKMIRQFREQNIYYQTQLKQRKQRLNNCFTLEMDEVIKSFVETFGIALHRIPIEGKIAVIQYDYNDRLVELDFYQENPYEAQIATFNTLSQRKLDKGISKMELDLLKQRFVYNRLSNVFDSFQIPSPQTLNSIEDQQIRQRLTYRYEQLIQRTKSDMMVIHTRAMEAKMEEYAKKFETDIKQFDQTQRTGAVDKKLTKAMCDIMEQRFKNINERLKTLYDLKVRFFVKAPTVKN